MTWEPEKLRLICFWSGPTWPELVARTWIVLTRPSRSESCWSVESFTYAAEAEPPSGALVNPTTVNFLPPTLTVSPSERPFWRA
jgi:hypothetical protein